MEIGSNKIGLIAKHRKFSLNFSDFVFPLKHFRHYDSKLIKVKVLFLSVDNFAYFLLVLSYLYISIIVWHAMQRC